MRTLPVRLALSTSCVISRTRPATGSATPGRRIVAGMPTAKPRQRLLRRVGLEIDRAVVDDAEQRLAGAGRGRAELRRAAADEAGDGRLHLGAGDAHHQLLPLGVAALAVGLGDAERVVGGGELRLRRLHRRLALLDGRDRHDAAAELLRAVEVARSSISPAPRPGRSGSAPGRSRRRRAWWRRRSGRACASSWRAVEAREHLALLHPVAVLGVELDDRKPVDPGGDLRLLARDERAGDEQPVDEFAPLGRRDA